MNIVSGAPFILAVALLATSPALCAGNQTLEPLRRSPHADGLQHEKFAVGLICKNARDLRNLFQTRAWIRTYPDPVLAVREVNTFAHDPKACEWATMLYEEEPEEVDRIVRKPDEIYLIVRFRPLDDTTFGPDGSDFRYIFLPGN